MPVGGQDRGRNAADGHADQAAEASRESLRCQRWPGVGARSDADWRGELELSVLVQGQDREGSLGQYPMLSLKEARTRRDEMALSSSAENRRRDKSISKR